MALDVYVGPFVFYFLDNWMTEPDQFLADHGIPEDLRGEHGEILTLIDVKRNRRKLRASTTAEAVTSIPLRLGWQGYEGLLLWAAYEETGGAVPADLPENALADPILQRARAIETLRYKHLLDNTEIWLPGNYDLTFRSPDPTGKRIDFGFTRYLLEELTELNRKTWQADMDTIVEWSGSSGELGTSLEACAQFGFSIVYRLALTSWKERLPMVLDY